MGDNLPFNKKHHIRAITADRNNAIWSLHRTGLSYAEIGRNYGISRQRVRQICAKAEQLIQENELRAE